MAQHHRHHGPVQGHKFSLGLAADGRIVGVAIVGRPVARHLDDGMTLEVTRCCTDGARNGCSKLYGAAWRATRALGYRRLLTYILASEAGASLRASGWHLVGIRGGGHRRRDWHHPAAGGAR
ncbi:XF1762 family protein [Pseudomonas aeruginosa]